jgi:hypothetical protein
MTNHFLHALDAQALDLEGSSLRLVIPLWHLPKVIGEWFFLPAGTHVLHAYLKRCPAGKHSTKKKKVCTD